MEQTNDRLPNQYDSASLSSPQVQNVMQRDGPTTAISRRGRGDDGNETAHTGCWQSFKTTTCAPTTKMQKVMCALFWTAFSVLAIVLFAVIFPRFVDRVVNPFIQVLRQRLSKLQIAAVIFSAVAILPFSIVITILPFVWVSGIIFDFPVALAIVMAGSTVGMSLQYLTARYLFHDRVERFVMRDQKNGLAVALRAVELAGPWKMVALLRLGPAPYHLLNYAMGICPSIKFHINIIASFICELLPRSLQVFFGKSLDSLADLFRGKVHNVGLAVYNIGVLLLGVVLVVVTVIYSKRLLRKLEEEELKREAAAAADEETGGDLDAAVGEDSFAVNVRGKETDRELDAYSKQVEHKVAAKPTGSEGDLQVLVDGSKNSGAAADACNSAIFDHSTSSCSSTIPVGHIGPSDLGSSSSSSTLSNMDRGLLREDSKLPS